MARAITGLCVAATFGLAVTLGAQSRPASQSSSTSDKEIHVTGCLERGASGGFVLANAQMGSGGAATGTSGTMSSTTSSSSSMPGSLWKLEGSTTDLEKHVGHKIQASGTEDKTSDSTSTATSTSPTDRESIARKLMVNSVKMIGSSCS